MSDSPSVGFRWGLTTQTKFAPHQCITNINVDILNLDSPHHDTIGKGRGRHIDFVCAGLLGFSPQETVETLTALTPVFDVILDPRKARFSSGVEETLGMPLPLGNVFHFAELGLLEAFRGFGLTLKTMHEAQRIFGPTDGLAVLECCPIQHAIAGSLARSNEWSEQLSYDQLELDKQRAETSLTEYYATLGFQRIDRTPVMIKHMIFPDPDLLTGNHGTG